MIAEYNSLRQESIAAISNRISVASFAFGAVAVILAGLMAKNTVDLAEGLVSLILVPQIAKAGLLIWLGEYSRSQRAGRAIAVLERKINRELRRDKPGSAAMGWEQGLNVEGSHMAYSYFAVMALLIGSSMVGAAFGSHLVAHWADPNVLHTGLTARGWALVTLVVTIEFGFAWFVIRKWRAVRSYHKDMLEDDQPR